MLNVAAMWNRGKLSRRSAQDPGYKSWLEGLPRGPNLRRVLPRDVLYLEHGRLDGIVPAPASEKAVPSSEASRSAVLACFELAQRVAPPSVPPTQGFAAPPLWFARLETSNAAGRCKGLVLRCAALTGEGRHHDLIDTRPPPRTGVPPVRDPCGPSCARGRAS